MKKGKAFSLKEDESKKIRFSLKEVDEIVPDADFRFSLVILKNGEKHFICGTEGQIREQLA